MRVTFGGVRGTRPVTGPRMRGYGGDTTALLIEGSGGECVLLDAGTGLQNLAAAAPEAERRGVLLLLTHYHLDHLQGLATSPLLYRKDLRVTLASPRCAGRGPAAAVRRLLAAPLWPVSAGRMPARLSFRTLPARPPAGGLRHGGLRVRWCPVQHPGGCHAYRIDEPATGAALVFATDIEWQRSTPAGHAALLELCMRPHPTPALAMDGQYDRRRAAATAGWGHSTWQDAVEIAEAAAVRRLLVTHHDPAADDKALARREREVRLRFSGATLARQGMQVKL